MPARHYPISIILGLTLITTSCATFSPTGHTLIARDNFLQEIGKASYSFYPMALGDTLSMPVILENPSGQRIKITSMRVEGQPNAFSLSPDRGNTYASTPRCIEETPFEHRCHLELLFAPSEARTYESYLMVTHTGYNSPLRVTLTGQGVTADLNTPAPPPAPPTPPAVP